MNPLSLALLLMAGSAPQTPAQPFKLSYAKGLFTVAVLDPAQQKRIAEELAKDAPKNKKIERVYSLEVPIKEPRSSEPKSVLYRKGNTFTVWDARGLTVRVGKKVFSTKLPEIPVTPKLFTKEQIVNTKARVKRGVRSLNAAGVSGSMRIANDVFFLLRWEEKGSKPWLEALVKLDLTAPFPKPQLVGRYAGLSLATRPIEQRLFIKDGRLSTVVKLGPAWGVSAYDPKTKEFGYLPIGSQLQGFALIGKLTAVYIEGTAYGPHKVGRADLDTGNRTELFESRGFVRLLDHDLPPYFLISYSGKKILRNPESGALAELPGDWGFRRTPAGILAWSPSVDPKVCRLYHPNRWAVLSTWAAQTRSTSAGRASAKGD